MTLTTHQLGSLNSSVMQFAVHSCPLLCLQREVAKLASRLFCCCPLLWTVTWLQSSKVRFKLR